MGYWKTDLKKLKSRYQTYYGDDLELCKYSTLHPIRCEKVFKIKFKKYNKTLELYNKEHLNEYKEFFEKIIEFNEEQLDEYAIILKNDPDADYNISHDSDEHKCPRCGYETDKISHFKNHLDRKNICKPKIADISLDKLRAKYFKEKIITHICEKCNTGFYSQSSYYVHRKMCMTNDNLEELKEVTITYKDTVNELKELMATISNKLKI